MSNCLVFSIQNIGRWELIAVKLGGGAKADEGSSREAIETYLAIETPPEIRTLLEAEVSTSDIKEKLQSWNTSVDLLENTMEEFRAEQKHMETLLAGREQAVGGAA